MRKQVEDIIKEEVIKTVSYHVKWHLQKKPTIQELEDMIDYYYSDNVKDFILEYGIYKTLLTLEYDINE